MTSSFHFKKVLFMDEGMYLFKLYRSNHSYDTSLAWALFLKQLVSSHHVPAILIP